MVRAVVFLAAMLLVRVAEAIVGGVPATLADAPGQVALVDLSRPTDASCAASEIFCKHYCAGVALSPYWVLTAAHCVDDGVVVGNLRVVHSVADIFAATEADTVQVEQKYVHPAYAGVAPFAADVALLRLASPVPGPYATLIDQTGFSGLLAVAAGMNDEVRATGWGRLSSEGAFPKQLRRVNLDLVDDAQCLSRYNTGAMTRYIASQMLCVLEDSPSAIEPDDAGDLTPLDEEGEGVCNYDSGGPLQYREDGQWRVVGLVSFAPRGNCASSDLPSVFTRVPAFLGWIEETVRLSGVNFGDIGLRISGDRARPVASAATITVRLFNGSQLPPGSPATSPALTGVGFRLRVEGDASIALASPVAGLSCVAVTGGLDCSYSTAMAAGVMRDAAFTITPAAGNQQVLVTAGAVVAAGNSLVDYRPGNNERTWRLLFSNQPDLRLQVDGFAQVLVNTTTSKTDGRAWVLGTIRNESPLVATGDLSLQAVLPAGYVWEAWEGLPACTAEACMLPALAAGEERLFRLRVFVPEAAPGDIQLIVSSPAGDFPALRDGAPDTEVLQSVAFNVVWDDSVEVPPVDPPPPPPGKVDSGGGAPWPWFLVGLGVLLRRRR